MDVLKQIHAWSLNRPAWQRDAIRRILVRDLTEGDIDELTHLCKLEGGVLDAGDAVLQAEPLTEDHIAGLAGTTDRVVLTAIRDVKSVNALANGHKLEFDPGAITVVYGDNGSGKTGYGRILKSVCRARAKRPTVYPNVFAEATNGRPSATIDYRVEDQVHSHEWKENDQPPIALSQVSVFDSECASVYVEEKTDVAYRPFGLDVFPKLVKACDKVKERLAKDIQSLGPAKQFDGFTAGTKADILLSTLSSRTTLEAIDAACDDSAVPAGRTEELNGLIHALLNNAARSRARDMRLKAKRFRQFADLTLKISDALSKERVEAVQNAKSLCDAAVKAAEMAAQGAFNDEPLPGVGSQSWEILWKAARGFAAVAYPDVAFPYVEIGARCVLCHQELGDDAAARLERFDEYVRREAQLAAEAAQKSFDSLHAVTKALTIPAPDSVDELTELLSHDEALCAEARAHLVQMGARKEAVLAACESGDWSGLTEWANAPHERIVALAADVESKAVELEATDDPENALRLKREHAELRDLERLRSMRADVVAEIERLQSVHRLQVCQKATDTSAITSKNTELTRTAITQELRERFERELRDLGLNHLTVSVEAKGGQKGEMYHKIGFRGANMGRAGVHDILSEGEYRCIALAAFFAELSMQSNASMIFFDDPVSSLDHHRRAGVARRLVKESAARPVVVMTHDLVFLLLLHEEAEKAGVMFASRFLQRKGGELGIPVDGLPWTGMKLTARIGVLKNQLLALRKVYATETGETYAVHAAVLWGRLREAWECAVEETLLNGAVRRFGREVQTMRLRKIHDITEADIETMELGMTESSKWLAGHTEAGEINAGMPGPDTLKAAIEQLDEWRAGIEKRRR